jgi:hypothetical protein
MVKPARAPSSRIRSVDMSKVLLRKQVRTA